MHPRWDARGPAEGEEQCRFRVALSETQSDGLRRLSQVAVPREAKLDVLSDIAEQSVNFSVASSALPTIRLAVSRTKSSSKSAKPIGFVISTSPKKGKIVAVYLVRIEQTARLRITAVDPRSVLARA